MKLTICLEKTTLIFYSILAPLIIVASLSNLINGVVLHKNSVVGIGAFSLFGFVLLPTLIVTTYRKNKCVIQPDKVSIGKTDYSSSNYNFYIQEKRIPFKHRPIFSPLRSTYYSFVIKTTEAGKEVLKKT